MLFVFKPQFNNNKEEHGNQRGLRPCTGGPIKARTSFFLSEFSLWVWRGCVDSGGPYQDPRGGLLSFPELLA